MLVSFGQGRFNNPLTLRRENVVIEVPSLSFDLLSFAPTLFGSSTPVNIEILVPPISIYIPSPTFDVATRKVGEEGGASIYGYFRYGTRPYGYTYEATTAAIGQDKIYRLSTLGDGGINLGSGLINTYIDTGIRSGQIRIKSDVSDYIVSKQVTLQTLRPTRFRLTTNNSTIALISDIGILRE